MTLDGKQFNLGLDKDQALEQYHRLMTMPPKQRLAGDSLAEICDAFLEWCCTHRKPRTYEWGTSRDA